MGGTRASDVALGHEHPQSRQSLKTGRIAEDLTGWERYVSVRKPSKGPMQVLYSLESGRMNKYSTAFINPELSSYQMFVSVDFSTKDSSHWTHAEAYILHYLFIQSNW